DIARGQAMINSNGLVLDVCEFTDQERFLGLNATGKDQFLALLADVVSGRTDVAERLRAREQSVLYRRRPGLAVTPAAIHADHPSSCRYAILDLVADNALGLLHRVSRAISRHGCDVDLVLISTEGQKAIDVFHITRAGVKLTDAAIAELTADIQRTLEG